MFAYEIWTTIAILGMVFAVLYPEDTANLIRLIGLTPSLIRVWFLRKSMMIRLWPRLALDNFMVKLRVKQIRKRHNSTANHQAENTDD
jgi:hypothetical protein